MSQGDKVLVRSGVRALVGRRRAERGFALPFAMIITVIVLVLGLAFLEMSRIEGARSAEDVNTMQALAAAELGLERARVMSSSQKCAWQVMTYDGSRLDFYPSDDPMFSGNYVCDLFGDEPTAGSSGETYSVVIEDLNDWMPSGTSYRIHAFGTSGNRTKHITLDAQTITYSSFGWLSDKEKNIYFASGDTVDGWVYTNDHLNIYYSPVFTGKVNSAASYVNYYHGGPPRDNPDFQQGLFLNSPELDMKSLINKGHITAVRDRALEDDGIHVGSNGGKPYLVAFASDGSVTISKKVKTKEKVTYKQGRKWKTKWVTVEKWVPVVDKRKLSTTNGAIYIEEHVQVSGTVNGQVTLATPKKKDIEIIDDLVYAYPGNSGAAFRDSFDFSDPQCNDKLGLIAGRDIVVKKPWSSGWNDMYVMASLLAVEGSFRNEYYTSRGFKTLHILGGVAQSERGPVGRTDNRGFLKDYKYDQRFYLEPPPHFPVVTYDYKTWVLEVD